VLDKAKSCILATLCIVALCKQRCCKMNVILHYASLRGERHILQAKRLMLAHAFS
jgi:hypothetical protein